MVRTDLVSVNEKLGFVSFSHGGLLALHSFLSPSYVQVTHTFRCTPIYLEITGCPIRWYAMSPTSTPLTLSSHCGKTAERWLMLSRPTWHLRTGGSSTLPNLFLSPQWKEKHTYVKSSTWTTQGNITGVRPKKKNHFSERVTWLHVWYEEFSS